MTAKQMARFVSEIGTGEIGMTNDKGPIMQSTAVINPIIVRFAVLVFLILFVASSRSLHLVISVRHKMIIKGKGDHCQPIFIYGLQ
jgi:hypothetical protein